MSSVKKDKFNKFDSDLNKLLNELPQARRMLDERISNYVENGHRIREPTGDPKTYSLQTELIYADESNLYQEASTALEATAIAEVEQFAENIRKKLEG